MKKKKILFTAYNLGIGGVEKALVNLLNNMDYNKYDVTLYLQLASGEFLDQVDKNVKIYGYNLSKLKNKILKRISNILKYLFILIKNFKKYDFSCCYAPGYPLSSILALFGSSSNAAWLHTNISTYMSQSDWYEKVRGKKTEDTTKKVKYFVNRMYFRQFKNKIFVSQNAMNAYLNIYPKDKCKVIYNIIDGKEIIEKSKIEIELKKDNVKTFIHVGRHTESDKRITRIINAAEKLKKDYNFKILLVGDGIDNSLYREMVKKLKLEKYVIFLGKKTNPFPYYKISDALILSSKFEGYPTVFLEAMILNIPIITTNVSDAENDIKDKYGIVVDNNDDSIYYGMKMFLDKSYKFKKFDYSDYNSENIKKMEEIFYGKI